jgi:Response regulator containing a CheY-like receiver domain and an HTH DNA-binding domain
MIRVGLVDDHPMVIVGVEAALRTAGDIEVVARGGTVAEARELLDRADLDVVLLDVRLEDGNGLLALAEREARGRPAVLVMSSFKTSQHVAAARKYGAAGFLLKTVPLPALIESIRHVATGATIFADDELTQRFVALTPRERAVVQLAMEGLSNKEIGARMGTSAKTAEVHLSEIYAKHRILGGRMELVIRAAAEGWLDIQPQPSRHRADRGAN